MTTVKTTPDSISLVAFSIAHQKLVSYVAASAPFFVILSQFVHFDIQNVKIVSFLVRT